MPHLYSIMWVLILLISSILLGGMVGFVAETFRE